MIRMRRLVRIAAVFAGIQVAYGQSVDSLTARERILLEKVEQLERRVQALEAKLSPAASSPAAPPEAPGPTSASALPQASPPVDTPSVPGFLAGTTLNLNFDGYYGLNFNRPVGRVNLVHFNDALSNTFSLGQADVILERTPDPSAGQRLGMRVDLTFGQNTEYLQASPLNEPRPQVYRNIFQAYGTYVAPIGKGLTIDFGKFASSLGIEGNYTKDQINYSRSYLFGFLPFYHMGFRAAYAFNPRVNLQYWLTNGPNQTEGFNGFRSSAVLVQLVPVKSLSWNVNYFVGQTQRDVTPDYNPGLPSLATQPGLSTTPIYPPMNGLQHVIDTYATWTVNPKLQLTGEGDYVIDRVYRESAPTYVLGAAAYFKYQLQPKWFAGGRFEYLSDHGGLFSGRTQALKEATATLTFQPQNGFQVRWEYRRDFSNQAFFLTHTPGVLARQQNMALLGLTWWLGGKQGSW